MKTLVISDYAERRGGACVVAIEQAVALQRTGTPVVFLYGLGGVDHLLREVGVEVVQAPALRLADRLALLFGINPGLERFLRGAGAGLVRGCKVAHVHGTTRYFGFRFVRQLRRLGLQTVWTVHDYVAWCPVGTSYNHRRHRPCLLRPLSVSCVSCHCDRTSYAHKLVRVARQLIIRRHVSRFVQRYLFVSPVARRTAERLAGRPLPGEVVWNPVATLPAENPEVGTGRALPGKRFVFVGRLCPEKGMRAMLRAAAVVDAEFLLIGAGTLPPGTPPNVRSRPHLAPAELARAIRGATALLLLSEWSETFGLVVAEAASIGVPSVVSLHCGVAELLPAGAGWVVDPADADGLARLLRRIAGSEEARLAGLRARRWFSECAEFRTETYLLRIAGVGQALVRA